MRKIYKHKRKTGKLFLGLVCLIIVAVTIYFYIDLKIRPFVRDFSSNKIESMAIGQLNDAITLSMNNNEDLYKNIATLNLDDQKNLIAVTTDTYKINKIKNEIIKEANAIINSLSTEKIQIPFGALYDTSLFFATGPIITVNVMPMSTPKVDFISSFETSGINQSMHKIILECTLNIKILLPNDTITFNVDHKVCLSETLVLGNVPESYTYIQDSNSLEKFNHYAN